MERHENGVLWPVTPELPAFAIYFSDPEIFIDTQLIVAADTTVWTGKGVFGVPIHVRKDGFIVFDFPKSDTFRGGIVSPHNLLYGQVVPSEIIQQKNHRKRLIYGRTDYMNSCLMAITSSLSSVQKAGSNVQPPFDPSNFFVANLTNNSRWTIGINADRNFKYQNDFSQRFSVKTDIFDESLNVMNRSHKRFGDEYMKIFYLIYLACYQYKIHQFNSAHLIAWSVIEKMINIIWKDFQSSISSGDDKYTEIGKIRSKLLNGRDFTASVIVQILSLVRQIDDEMLGRLNEARKKRNDFAHNLSEIDADHAGKAIRVATDLISQLIDRPFHSQLSMRFLM